MAAAGKEVGGWVMVLAHLKGGECCLYGCFIHHILSYSFGSILYNCIYGCMFCMLLFNFVNDVLLLLRLCILIVMYVPFWVLCFIVLFYVLFVCKCVLYYCHRVTTQSQLTNISYITSYHIISYHIISYHTPRTLHRQPAVSHNTSFL